MKAKFSIFVFSVTIAFLILPKLTDAGTLYCTLRTSACSSGETEVYRMSATTNAHAQLPGQTPAYSQVVCCGGVTGLGTSCSGTFATVLNLSLPTNAHGQESGSYGNAVCLSVPSGGAVSAGFASDCIAGGYDTSLGALSATTNAHFATSTAAYTNKICATAAGAGSLSVDIVDANGTPVASPSVAFGSSTFSFSLATTTATFGTSSQKIRVSNSRPATFNWTLTAAATSTTAVWYSGTAGTYSYNTKGGGRLFVDPTISTVTPQSGCSTTGISKGSYTGFNGASIASITLLSHDTTSNGNCYWDLTGVSLSQRLPSGQIAGNYNFALVLTVN